MRKVIDGLLYDTATATLVHEWSNGYPNSDFHYCDEGLYKTQNGRWFLAGEGGALSSYGIAFGDGKTGSSRIRPMEPIEAEDWLEQHDAPADVVAKHFEVKPA